MYVYVNYGFRLKTQAVTSEYKRLLYTCPNFQISDFRNKFELLQGSLI